MITPRQQQLPIIAMLMVLILSLLVQSIAFLYGAYYLSQLINGTTISLLVIALLLLSVISKQQHRQCYYPLKWLLPLALLLSLLAVLIINYLDPLQRQLIGQQYYWKIFNSPLSIYYFTASKLLRVLLLIACCQLLLWLAKPFATTNSYKVSTPWLIITASLWAIALNYYQTTDILTKLTIDLGSSLAITNNNLWLVNAILIVTYSLSQVVPIFYYKARLTTEPQYLFWTSIIIWALLLIMSKALLDIIIVLKSHAINSGLITLGFYAITLLVSYLVFGILLKINKQPLNNFTIKGL